MQAVLKDVLGKLVDMAGPLSPLILGCQGVSHGGDKGEGHGGRTVLLRGIKDGYGR